MPDMQGLIQAARDALVANVQEYYAELGAIAQRELAFQGQLLASRHERPARYDVLQFQRERMIAASELEKRLIATISDYHYRAAALGKGEGLNLQEVSLVAQQITRQKMFLRGFINELPKLSQGQAEVRAGSYAGSISQAANIPALNELPQLPQRPGDGQTECKYWCKCHLKIEPVEGAGNWNVYWRLGQAEHCPDCVSLAARWNPLEIRSWAITGTKSVTPEELSKLRSMLAIATAAPAVSSFKGREAYASLVPTGESRVAINRLALLLKQRLGDIPGAKWQDPATYHITLVYASSIRESDLQIALARLPSAIGSRLSLVSDGLITFDNPSEGTKALCLSIRNASDLYHIQQEMVYRAFQQTGVLLSDYSRSVAYTPHLTLAYVPTATAIPADFGKDFAINIGEIAVQRDNYLTVSSIPMGTSEVTA